MKPISLLATLLVLAAGSVLAAEDMCPIPVGMQVSVGAAKEAINAKQEGMTKEGLLKKAPQGSENPWLPRLLSEIANEVYQYPTLRPEVYAAYRFELCFVSSNAPEKAANIKFSDAHPLLKQCELLPQEGERPPCAMKVVHTISGIPE